MALLVLKMALIHPKKVQIGYKLDQNTNLVNNFEDNRRKYKEVKIQRKIWMIFTEKSAFYAENHDL